MPAQRVILFVALSLCGLSCSDSDPTPAPSISGFTPAIGPATTKVTITGVNFSGAPTQNDVRFNGTKANVISSTATTITAEVPQGATSGVITVSVNGQTSVSAKLFMVNPLFGQWIFTGAAATNCADPVDEGVVPCSLNCPILEFLEDTITFSDGTTTYTFNYTLSATTVNISSAGGSFSPGYVIADDRLTLVYPPVDCLVTETYVRL